MPKQFKLKGLCQSTTNLQCKSILNKIYLMLSKRYKSTEVECWNKLDPVSWIRFCLGIIELKLVNECKNLIISLERYLLVAFMMYP